MRRFTSMLVHAGLIGAVVIALAPSAATQVEVPGIDKPVVVVDGRITSNTTWRSELYYVLRGAVFVESGASLRIEPGTTIVGETATQGTLVIARGGRILADGRADAPIVFTSDQPVGDRGRGDWGGLIINGRAPLNVSGGEAIGEGDTGVYGGDNPNDSSGVLRYVRVEFAGIEFSPDNELNGIAFQGVGRGTVVDHVQVKANKDDGVEFFGGTVDAKHLVLTNIADDSVDWTDGWTGRLQFVVAHQRGDDADNGIEADNSGDNNNLQPRSNPTIYNATFIGDPDRNEGSESNNGMLLREGTAATIRNFIVMGFKEFGVNIDGGVSLQQARAGALSLANGILFQNAVLADFAHFNSESAPLFAGRPTIRIADPGLIDPYNHERPNYRPRSDATLAGGQLAPAVPPNDGFFQVTTFIGALSPDPAQDWTRGWTNFEIR
ncbi:MAG: T9SS C-terminal target domain-containing protein [Luteitalea sp.]|nr:T9SS C-terminal target domain-containing protein [Luteitalea sp.]